MREEELYGIKEPKITHLRDIKRVKKNTGIKKSNKQRPKPIKEREIEIYNFIDTKSKA